MIFYLLGIMVLLFSGAELYSTGMFHKDYLSKDNTTGVRGVFVLLIVAAHLRQYVSFDSVWDTYFLTAIRFMDQGIVCLFLFYSGYGIGEAVKRKGLSYVKKMPLSRILPTLLNFDIAIVLYLAVNAALGTTFPLKTILKSLIAVTSVGNSNWYIFAILVCYAVTCLVFMAVRGNRSLATVLITLALLGYVILLSARKPSEGWWYNTIFCYPLGLIYSEHRERIEMFVFSETSRYRYGILLTIMLVLALLLKPYRTHLVIYEIWSLIFTMAVVLLSAKIRIENRWLLWVGRHTFEIYILQRIPMMLLKHFGLDVRPHLFVMLSVVLVLAMAYLFGKVTGKVTQICKRLLI